MFEWLKHNWKTIIHVATIGDNEYKMKFTECPTCHCLTTIVRGKEIVLNKQYSGIVRKYREES